MTMTTLQELQDLRAEVRAWLAESVPSDLVVPPRGDPLPEATMRWNLEFRRRLGERGWLAPNWPTYLGGGGLSYAAACVVMEERSRWRLPTLPVSWVWAIPLRYHGTEEQKARWLVPTLRGEITVHMILSERKSSGTDLATQNTTAIRDGDFYVVTGEKGHVGSPYPADYLFILVNTDPGGPRYENLSMVVVRAKHPGVSLKKTRTLAGTSMTSYELEGVDLFPQDVIGGIGNGWEVAQTVLDVERGGFGITLDQLREVEERERLYWGEGR